MSLLTIPALDAPALERYGYPEFRRHTSPAAGLDFSYQLPGEFYVRLLAIHCKFVADGNAASREVVVSFEDAESLRYGLAGINTTVTASNTAYYEFSVWQPEAVATVDSSALVPMPALILSPTQKFKLHVVNIQATDQLSEVRTIWERFYTTYGPQREGPHSGL